MLTKSDIFADPELTRSATFKDKPYDCMPGAVDETTKDFPEEVTRQAKFTLRFWVTDFKNGVPVIGDRITFNGAVWRVLGKYDRNGFQTVKYAMGNEYGR